MSFLHSRHRSSDVEEVNGHKYRNPYKLTVVNIIAILVFLGTIGGLYADNKSKNELQDERISENRKGQERDRQEIKEEVKEIKQKVEMLNDNVIKLITEIRKERKKDDN